MENQSMEDAAYLLKAISNGIRLRVIALLKNEEELTVSQMIGFIDCEQSLLSHHLTDMRAKGVLNCRKEGKHCFYSLKNKQFAQVLDCIQHCNCSKI